MNDKPRKGFVIIGRLEHPGRSPMVLVEHASPNEHTAILQNPAPFDSLCRKDDLLAEGVAAVFGVRGTSAELLALHFQAGRFSPGEAEQWLQDRRVTVLAFNEATGNDAGSEPLFVSRF